MTRLMIMSMFITSKRGFVHLFYSSISLPVDFSG